MEETKEEHKTELANARTDRINTKSKDLKKALVADQKKRAEEIAAKKKEPCYAQLLA